MCDLPGRVGPTASVQSLPPDGHTHFLRVQQLQRPAFPWLHANDLLATTFVPAMGSHTHHVTTPTSQVRTHTRPQMSSVLLGWCLRASVKVRLASSRRPVLWRSEASEMKIPSAGSRESALGDMEHACGMHGTWNMHVVCMDWNMRLRHFTNLINTKSTATPHHLVHVCRAMQGGYVCRARGYLLMYVYACRGHCRGH